MNQLNDNGYIIQRKINNLYQGVDGDNWYLNHCSSDRFFEMFYDEYINKVWANQDYVDCCTDESYIEKYVKESTKLGIEFRILGCSTCRRFPIMKNRRLRKKGVKLGYDFAYSGGSYYSSILNDIISGRIESFKTIRLNKNGLFDTYEEANQFKEIRNQLLYLKSEYYLEPGDFIIYEVTEVIL